MTMSFFSYENHRPLLFILYLIIISLHGVISEDFYSILGVSKTASTQEIKKAYRRKALDTHPDKVKDIPKEEAAEAFRKVVEAFETLSDPESRRFYDRGGGSRPRQQQGRGGGGSFHFQFNFQQRRPVRLKDKFDVKEAQSRVLHVLSLEQLRTIILDENDRLERNVLISFVVPGDIETHVNDEMVFPYPFAGFSSQKIWWEDVLQTMQIRFNNKNELTEFFNIPHGNDIRESGNPIFLFGRRGELLSPEKMRRFEGRSRADFEKWVWSCIEVQVEFVNEHNHPVEVYWVHGTKAKLVETLDPGQTKKHTSMLTHEFFIWDARVDRWKGSPGRWKLTNESSLGTVKILSDTSPYVIPIHRKDCIDLSGHCSWWKGQGECKNNPTFMAETCPRTCLVCNDADPSGSRESIKDEL